MLENVVSGILQLRYESSDNAVMMAGYIRIVSSLATKRNASLFPFVDAFFFDVFYCQTRVASFWRVLFILLSYREVRSTFKPTVKQTTEKKTSMTRKIPTKNNKSCDATRVAIPNQYSNNKVPEVS